MVRLGKFNKLTPGFTIIELLVVIVVIAILATITVIAYNGITNQAKAAAAQSAASQGYNKIATYAVSNGDSYPTDLTTAGLPTSGSTYYEYSVDDTDTPHTFCLTATVSGNSYYVSNTSNVPVSGLCSGHTGTPPSYIQTITSSNCPSTRTMAVDARDNHTYWVQKLADGKCWMLTDLAYAGGGTNTYGDVRTLTNGTNDAHPTITSAEYYIPTSGSNVTTNPTNPSTSTDGTGQYGYLYNWCGAMGGQATAACADATTPTPNTSISSCPAGWRLPTGGASSELVALNTAVNAGSTSSDAGLRTTWLAQYGGYWNGDYGGFGSQGSTGYYWSGTQVDTDTVAIVDFGSSYVEFSTGDSGGSKDGVYTIRCLTP